MTARRFIERLNRETEELDTIKLATDTGLSTRDIDAFKNGVPLNANKVLVIMAALGYNISDPQGNPVVFISAGVPENE